MLTGNFNPTAALVITGNDNVCTSNFTPQNEMTMEDRSKSLSNEGKFHTLANAPSKPTQIHCHPHTKDNVALLNKPVNDNASNSNLRVSSLIAHFHEKTGEETSTNSRKSKPPWKCNSRGSLKAAHSENNSHSDATLHDWSNNHNIGYKASNFRPKLNLQQGGNIHSALQEDCRSHLYTNGRLKSGASDSLSRDTQDKNNSLSQGKNHTKKSSQLCEDNIKREKSSTNTQNLLISDDVPSYSSYHGLLSATERAALRPELHSAPYTPQETKEAKPKVLAHNLICPVSEVADNGVKLKDPTLNSVSHEPNYVNDVPWTQFQRSKTPLHTQLPFASNAEHNQANFNRQNKNTQIQGDYRKSGRDAVRPVDADADALAPLDSGTHGPSYYNESSHSANLGNASPIITPQVPGNVYRTARSQREHHRQSGANPKVPPKTKPKPKLIQTKGASPQQTVNSTGTVDKYPNSPAPFQGYHNAAERAASRPDLHSAPRTPHKSGETKPKVFGHNLRSPVSEVPDKGVSFKNPTVNRASHESHYVSDVSSTQFHSSKTSLYSQSPLAGNAEHSQASANDGFFVQPKPVHGIILGESERSVRNTRQSNTETRSINGNTSDFSKHQPFDYTIDHRPSETDRLKDCHLSLSSQSTEVSRLSQSCSNLDKIEKEPDDNMYGSATSIRDLVARYEKNKTDKNAPLTMDAATKQAMTGRENPNTRTAEPQTGYSDTRNEQLSHTQKSEPVFRSDKSSCPSRTITSIEEEDDYSTNSPISPKTHKNTYPPSLSSNELGSEKRPDLSYLPSFKPETSFSKDVANDSREVFRNVPAMSVNIQNTNTKIQRGYRKGGRGETRPVNVDDLATLDSGTHCLSHYNESSQYANLGHSSTIVTPQMPENVYPTAMSEREQYRQSGAKPKVPPKTKPKPKFIQTKGASPQQTVNSTGTADEYRNSPAHSHTFTNLSTINVTLDHDSVSQTKPFSSTHENAVRSRDTDDGLKKIPRSPELTPHRKSQSEDRSHISTYGPPSAHSARTENQMIQQHSDQPQFNQHVLKAPSGIQFPKGDYRPSWSSNDLGPSTPIDRFQHQDSIALSTLDRTSTAQNKQPSFQSDVVPTPGSERKLFAQSDEQLKSSTSKSGLDDQNRGRFYQRSQSEGRSQTTAPIQGEYRKSGRYDKQNTDDDALAPPDYGTHCLPHRYESNQSANLDCASPIVTPQMPETLSPRDVLYRSNAGNHKVCTSNFTPQNKMTMVDRCRSRSDQRPQHTLDNLPSIKGYGNSSIEGNPPLLQKHADVHPKVKVTCKIEKQAAFDDLSGSSHQGYHNAAERAASRPDLHSAPRTPHKSGEAKPKVFGHNLTSPVSEVPDKGVSFKNPTVNRASHEPHYVSDVPSTHFHSSKTTLHSQSPLAGNAEHNQASANDGFFVQPKPVHGVILGESERSVRNTLPSNTKMKSINGNTSDFSKHQPFSSTVDDRPSETDGFKDCHSSLSSQSTKVSRLSQSCSNLDKIEKEPDDNMYGSATSIRELVSRYEKNKTDKNAPLIMNAATKQATTKKENAYIRTAEPQTGYSDTRNEQLSHTQKSEPIFRSDKSSCFSRTIPSIEEEDDYSTNNPISPKTHKDTYPPSLSSNELGSVKRPDLSHLPSFKPETSFTKDVANDSREAVGNVPAMSVNIQNTNTQIQGGYRKSGRGETRPVNVDALATLDSGTHCLSHYNESSQSTNLGNASPIVTPQMPGNIYPTAKSEIEHNIQSRANPKVPPKTKPKPKLIQTKGASPQQTVNSTGTTDEYPNSSAYFYTFTKPSTINVHPDSVGQTKQFSSPHENAIDQSSHETDEGLKMKLASPESTPHRISQSEDRSHISTYGAPSAGSARTQNQMIPQHRDQPQFNHNMMDDPSGMTFPEGDHRRLWPRNDSGSGSPTGRFQHLDANTLSTADRETEQNKQPSLRSDVLPTPGSENRTFVQSNDQHQSSISKPGLDDHHRGRSNLRYQSEGRSQTSAPIHEKYLKSRLHDTQSTDADALPPLDSDTNCLPYLNESNHSAKLENAPPIVTPQMPKTLSPRGVLCNAGNNKVCTSNLTTQNEMTKADRNRSRSDQRLQHSLDNLPFIKDCGNLYTEGNPPLSPKHADVDQNVKETCKIDEQAAFDVLSDSLHKGYHNATERAASRPELRSAPCTPQKSAEAKSNLSCHNLTSPVSEKPDKSVNLKDPKENRVSHEPQYASNVHSTHFSSSKTTLHSQLPLASNAEHNQASANYGSFVQPKVVHEVILGKSDRANQNTPPSNTEMRSVKVNTSDFSKHQPFSSTIDHRPSGTDGFKDCHPSLSSPSTKVSRLSQSCSNLDKIEKEPDDNMYGSATSIRELVARYDKNTTDKNAPLTMDAAAKQAMTVKENPYIKTADPQTGYCGIQDKQLSHTHKSEVFRSDKSSCPSRTITSIEEEGDYSANSPTQPKRHKNTYPPSLSGNKLGLVKRPDLSYLPRFKIETSFSKDVANDSREVVENVPAISVNRRNKNTQIEEEYRKRGRGETRPVDADTKADALATLDSGTHCPSYYIESNQSANQGNASPIVSPQMPGNIYPTAKSEIEHNRESDAKPKVPPKTMPKPKLIQTKRASPQQTVNSTGRSTADEYPNSPAHSHIFIKPSAINVHPDSLGQTKQFSSTHENVIDLRSRETDNDLKMKLASPESTPHRRSQSEDRSHISTYGTPSAGSARTQNQIIRQHRDQPQFNHNMMDGPSGMPFPMDDHRRLTVHSQLPLASNAEHNQASASDGSFVQPKVVHGVILGENDRANENTLPSNTEMRSVKVNTSDFSKHQPLSSTIEHRSSGTDGFKDCHPSLSSHSAKVSRLSQSCSNLDKIEKEPDENMYGSATSITKLVARYEKNKIDENAPLTLDAAAKLTMTVGKENQYIKRAGYSGTQEKQLCPSQTTDPVFRSGKESCFSQTITSIEEEGGYSSNSPPSPKRCMNTYPPSLSSNKLGPVKTPDLSYLPSFKPETSFSKDVANDSREVVGNVFAGSVNRQNINTQIQGGYRKSGRDETRPVNVDALATLDSGTHCLSHYNESSQSTNLGNASPIVTPQMPGNIYPTAKSEIEHNIQSRANPKVPPKTKPKPKLIQTKGAFPQQTVNSTGTTDEYPNSSVHFYTFTKPSTINVHPDSVGQTKQFSSPHENAIDQSSHETDEGLKMKLASPESTPHRISQSEDRSHISTYGAPSAGSARTQNQMIPQHRDQPQFNHNMMDDPSDMTFPEGDHRRLWPRNDSGSGSPTGRFQHLDANTLSTADIGTKQNKQPSYQSNVQFNDQHLSSINSRLGVDDQHRGRSHLRSQSEGRSQTSAPIREEYRKSGLHDTQSTYADALAPLDSGTHCLPYLNESNQTNLRNGNPTVAPKMPGNFSPTVRSRFEREQYRQRGGQPEVLMKPKLLPPKGASSEQSVNVTGMAGEYPNPPAHSHTFTRSSKKNVKFHPDSVGLTKNSPSAYAVSDEKPRRARETDYGFEKRLASPESIQHRRSKNEDRSSHGPPRASSRKPSVPPPNKNVNVQNKSSHRKPAGCDSSSESDSEDGCSPPVCFEDFVQLCSKLKKSGLTRSCPNINIYMQPVTQDKRKKKKITVNRPRAVGIGNKSMKLYDGNDNESESEETDSNDDDEDDGKTVTL